MMKNFVLLSIMIASNTAYAGNIYLEQAQKDLQTSAEQNKKQLQDNYAKNTAEAKEEARKNSAPMAITPPTSTNAPASSMPAWQQAVTPPTSAEAPAGMSAPASKPADKPASTPESSSNIYR